MHNKVHTSSSHRADDGEHSAWIKSMTQICTAEEGEGQFNHSDTKPVQHTP